MSKTREKTFKRAPNPTNPALQLQICNSAAERNAARLCNADGKA